MTSLEKRQNTIMHLVEAYLALERSAPGRGFLHDVAALIAFFERRLFPTGRRVLLEYLTADWAPHPDPAKGRVFEPGHHLEWIRLLREYELLSGEDLA